MDRSRRSSDRRPRRWARGSAELLGGEFLATQALVLLCLVVFGLAMATDKRLPILPEAGWGQSFRFSTLLRFGVLVPHYVGSEPWRLLSAVFLHFSAVHLAMNLWGLVALGRELEQRFGTARSFIVFLAAGLGGFVVSYWWYGAGSPIPTAGASGGVFGQLGALVGWLVARRVPAWKDLVFQNLAYALVMAFMLRVNNAAHLGGALIGFGLGFLLEKERVRSQATRVLGALAVILALCSVASVVLSFISPEAKAEREQEAIEE